MAPPNLTSPPPPFTVDQFARFWAAPDTSLIVAEMFAPDVVGDWPGDSEPARGFARQYGSTNQAEERPHLVHELLRLLEMRRNGRRGRARSRTGCRGRAARPTGGTGAGAPRGRAGPPGARSPCRPPPPGAPRR